MTQWTSFGFILSLVTRSVFADDVDTVQLAMVEHWTTAFADEDVATSVRVSSGSPAGTVRWSQSIDGRTLARGEAETKRNEDKSATAEILLRSQPLRDGLVLSTILTSEFVPEGSNEVAATLNHTITLCSRDPLSGRTEWMKKDLNITVFDPAETICKAFDDLNWPYHRAQNLATLNNHDDHGVFIIGEGISWAKERSTAETALQKARAGGRVIILAPGDGVFPVPDLNRVDDPMPGELRFARQHVITQLDKRLDALAWRGAVNTVPFRGVTMEVRRGRIEAVVSDRRDAWPWMELRFPETQGVLIMCGFRIIDHWDDSPTPRYLLAAILQTLTKNGE